jgi:hypothetical protein
MDSDIDRYRLVFVPVEGGTIVPNFRVFPPLSSPDLPLPTVKTPFQYTIGRLPDCNTVINLPVISGVHCTIHLHFDGGGKPVVVLSNSSANGVWIDNQMLKKGERRPLHHGEVVSFCKAVGQPHVKHRLHIFAPGESEAIEATPLASIYTFPTLLPSSDSLIHSEPSRTTADASIASTAKSSDSVGSVRRRREAFPESGSSSTKTPRDIRSVTRVGSPFTDYEFVETLGDGAYSIVYKTRKLQDHERPKPDLPRLSAEIPEYVAVKRVDISKTNRSAKDHKTGVNPLEEEIRILAALDNPHIVKLFEVVQDPNPRAPYLFIVQELVTGGELFNKVVGKGMFEEAQARGLFRQLLKGVSYLHSKGVVHRYVPPHVMWHT